VPQAEPRREATAGDPRRRLIIEVLVGYLAAWLVGIGFGFALSKTSTWEHGAQWERAWLTTLNAHPLPALLDRLMLAMPYLGTNLTILPAMIVLAPILWKKFRQPLIGIQLFIVCIGSLSLNPTMKYLLGRPRPDLFPLRGMWTWASYPSGHMILTTALYFTVSLMLWRWRRWWWPFPLSALIVLVTGYSRIYLSVHWPTDLIGGMLIGITWLLTSWRAFHRYHVATR
jgi:membrane-associated phospholipid phosphatase